MFSSFRLGKQIPNTEEEDTGSSARVSVGACFPTQLFSTTVWLYLDPDSGSDGMYET